MQTTTFENVAAYLSNPANYPTTKERATAARESARLDALRRAWCAANNVPENYDPFAQFA